MIPEAEIKEVKQSVDILSLFRSYGLKLERKGKDWFTSCPFHGDDKPSLSIDPTNNLFHCLGCGEKGNALQLVQKMENISFPAAFEKLGGSKPNSKKINGNGKKTVIPIPKTYTKANAGSFHLQHNSPALPGCGTGNRI